MADTDTVPAPKASKAAAAVPAVVEVAAPPAEFPVTLDEACRDLSRPSRDYKRASPTLLAAFHSEETLAGRYADTVTAYRARLEAFRVRPV